MKRITKINAAAGLPFSRKKRRVAAYCRVSTNSDEQLLSLENQTTHYTDYIKANSDWEFVGLYYDEGLSGTKMSNRDGLQRLISDCEKRLIDFIITKSISRFARNTTGCLETVRRLSELGIAVLFEKENIDTGTMDGELLLTVLSSLAESESVSLSENSKWSVKARMQNGTYKLSKAPYGYELVDNMLIPKLEQAAIVRRIYAEFLSGKGYQSIIKALNMDGIKPMRSDKWTDSSIHWILVNERYIGDVRLRKTYSDHKFQRHTNYGEVEQYYIHDHHEPIISREDFEKVQEVLEQRREASGSEKGSQKYMNRYAFSGKITCGDCGSRLKRFARQSKTCGLTVDWRCDNRKSSGNVKCGMPYIQEETIQAAFLTVMQRLYTESDSLIYPHIQRLREQDSGGYVQKLNELENLIHTNAERVRELVGFMSKGYLTPALYSERMNELQAEAAKLKEQKAALAICDAGQQSSALESEALYKYLSKDGKDIKSYSDELFTRFVEGVTVFSHNKAGFRLKCGLVIKETLVRFRRTADGIKPVIQWDETKWAKKGAAKNGNK